MGDYYEILELTREADEDMIKKAYRRLALKWHPDKNPNNKTVAEAKFKLVSEAYQILSDPQKKATFDRYGKDAVNNGAFSGARAQPRSSHANPFGGIPGFGFGGAHDDIFNQMFSGGGGAFFRDPFEMFREFFGGQDPFAGFDDMFDHHHHHHQHHQNMFNRQPVNLFGFGGGFGGGGHDPFGFGMPLLSLGSLLAGGGGGHSSSFSSFGGGGGFGGGMNSTMTTHQFINGKSVQTKKEISNGVETVSVFEDGLLKRKTVNGQDVLASLPAAGGESRRGSNRSANAAAVESPHHSQRHSPKNHHAEAHRSARGTAHHHHAETAADEHANRRVIDEHARRQHAQQAAASARQHRHHHNHHHAEPMVVSPEDSPRVSAQPPERTPSQRSSQHQHDAHANTAASRLKRMVSGSDDDVQIIGSLRRHSPKVVRPNDPAVADASIPNGTRRRSPQDAADSPLTSTARVNLVSPKTISPATNGNSASRLPQRSATMSATPNRPQYKGSLPAQPASVLLQQEAQQQQQQQADPTSPQAARTPNTAAYSKWFKDFKIR